MEEKKSQCGNLLIIADQPPVGDNTAIMLNMAKTVAVDQYVPAVYYSMGMPNVDVCNRLISIVTGIDYETIANGKLSDAEWATLDRKIHTLMKSPLFIDDTTELAVSKLREDVKRMVGENGLKLVEIDHMSKMTADGMTFDTEQEKLDYITSELRALADELGITIIAVQN